MATKQLEKTHRSRHQFFASQTEGFTSDAIYIPDSPLFLKNNCKEGAWQLGDTNYGNRLKLAALKFSRYLHIGNDTLDPGTPIGQLWFCPLDGGVGSDEQGNEIRLALNLVYYTLLKNSKSGKSGSLINFGQKAALLQAEGIDYREVVWIPRFVKKSGTLIDILSSEEQMGKLLDPTIEGECKCVDGLKPVEIAKLASSMATSAGSATASLPVGAA